MSDGKQDNEEVLLDRWDIPASWAWERLGKVCVVASGGTPDTKDDANFKDGTIPWITPADLSGYRDKQIAFGERNITQKGLDESSATLLPTGTVLFSSRAPIGYVAIASVPVSTNQGFKNFIPPTQLFPDYLYFYLQRAKPIALELASGTTFLEISAKRVAQIPLPLPPLPEQHRIVEKIEELFSDLDAGVASLERAKANLKRYRASVLKSAVEGRLTEEWRKEHPQAEDGQMLLDRILRERREKWEKDQLAQFKKKGKEPPKNWQSKYEEPSAPDTSKLPELPVGWAWATVNQLNWVRSGQTPPDIKDHLRASGDIPWFTVGDMNHEANTVMMNHADKFLSHASAESLGMHLHPPRTIIFPKRGGAIATNKKRQLATVGSYDLNTMGIIPPEELHSYIWVWFIGVDLRNLSDGSNVPQINHNDIEPLLTPLPPLAEQEQIVSLVEERLSQIDSAEKTIDSELIRSKRLRQSILKRAFEGKLVPQDPKDEPASVLLERIKASREAEQPKKKAKKVKAK